MNPLLVFGLVAAGVLAFTLLKSANTATSLYYNVLKFGIYNFVQGSKIVFRLVLRITNPTNTPLHVNLVNITAYLNGSYVSDNNGNVVVQSRGTQIGSVADNQPWVIAANNFTEKAFYIECSWVNIGKILLGELINSLTNNSLNNLISELVGKPVLIDGVIAAEGITVPVSTIVQISNDN